MQNVNAREGGIDFGVLFIIIDFQHGQGNHVYKKLNLSQ